MDLFKNRLLTFVVLLTAQVVLGERTIVTNPSNATTTRGETVIFRCTVTPATDGSYVVWMQKGIQISSNYDVRTSRVDPQRYSVNSESIGEEYNLQITDTNSLDSGSYWCVVKSGSTSVLATSTTAWLRYKAPPSVEYPDCSSEVVYQEGDQVAYTCRSGVAVPPVALAWEDENRVALDAEQRSVGIFEITELTRTLTRADNSKTFRCNLTHELVEGERSCSVGPLNVEYPPTGIEIEDTSSDGILYVGGSISLECKADANPPADFEWMVPFDIPERKFEKIGKLLSVFDVQSGFDGLSVECVASNKLGETKTSSVITVTVPTTTTVEMRGTTILATKTQQTSSPMPAEVPKVPTAHPRRSTPEVKHNTPMPTGDTVTYATTGSQGGQNSRESLPSTNPKGSPQPYATTGRQVPRKQGSNPIFEYIPMRSVTGIPTSSLCLTERMLQIETQRLAIEEARLAIEKERLQIEKFRLEEERARGLEEHQHH